jgi:peptide/nickel transport system substrate-binding protein
VSDWQRDWSKDLVVYGPYRLDEGATAEQFVLRSLEPGGLPDLGFAIVRDKETHYQLLRAGQADFSWTLPVARIPEIRTSLQAVFYPEHSFGFLGWNPIDPAALAGGKPFDKAALTAIKQQSPHPLFGDVRVRRALTLALNREGYIERFWYGATSVPATPWQAGLPYHASAVQVAPRDPGAAGALLDEAGWLLADGRRQKDGTALAFTVISVAGSEIREQYLLAIQRDLAQLGITMEIDFQEASRFIQNCVGGNYDAMLGLFQTPSRPDLSALYHSESQYNFTSWTAVDDLLTRVSDAGDGQTLRAGLTALEAAFVRDCPLTLLYEGIKVGAARKELRQRANYLDPLFAVEQWVP